MSKKSPKIAALIADCNTGEFSPHYLGYFKCFNARLYYEAHDVLEELWLQDRNSPDDAYYKGLIQAAGAFVHLQKQFDQPTHPVHGRRLRPAGRLLILARHNLAPFAPMHLGFDVTSFRNLLQVFHQKLEGADFTLNPYSPDTAPHIDPPGR
ncbi:MAG: DUF309 domain-containing protein [Verrucomicrobiae bacterium]|nr:DUF309 domain-containing protein [Verrucomicrobiae bacterium]